MDTKLLYFLLVVCFTNTCRAQLTQDYPFKTYMDGENNLYVTGNRYNSATGSIDILTEKYDEGGDQIWSIYYTNSYGPDRGLDIAVDEFGNTFVTGFVFSQMTNSNDVIVIKYNSDGTEHWNRRITNIGDDKGMGIDITTFGGYATDVYISGYLTSPSSGKDFFVRKYSAGTDTTSIQHVLYRERGDDVATEIHLDAGHAYVAGFTDNGPAFGKDIMILAYDRYSLALDDTLIYAKSGSDEMPTGFIISETSESQVQKSRSVVICVTDNFGIGTHDANYLTIFFNEDLDHNLQVRWSREYSNSLLENNIGTSITADTAGSVYVAGYVYNYDNSFQSNGLDFATLKYKWNNGQNGWNVPVKFHNYCDSCTAGINDRASSIKVNEKNDVYVAGMSDAALNGYSYVKYVQTTQNKITKVFEKPFVPEFLDGQTGGTITNKWATLELANDGTPLLVVMGWNDSDSYWAAQRYDSSGNVLYTINNFQLNREASNSSNKIKLANYPNPFNPSTTISFQISSDESKFVQIKVYNMLGEEVSTLLNEFRGRGLHKVKFDGSGMSSGVYFYRTIINGIPHETKRMMLVK